MRRAVLAVFLCCILAGCGSVPVAPDAKLAGAPAWAIKKAIGPSDVPQNDGDPAVRAPWQTNERENHARCVARQHVLVDYINAIRK